MGWHPWMLVHAIVFCATWLDFTWSVLPRLRSLVVLCFALCVCLLFALVVVSLAGVGFGNVDALSLFIRCLCTYRSHLFACLSLSVHLFLYMLHSWSSCLLLFWLELTSHVALFALCLYWRQMLLTFTWDAYHGHSSCCALEFLPFVPPSFPMLLLSSFS